MGPAAGIADDASQIMFPSKQQGRLSSIDQVGAGGPPGRAPDRADRTIRLSLTRRTSRVTLPNSFMRTRRSAKAGPCLDCTSRLGQTRP